jgi:cytochrome P450
VSDISQQSAGCPFARAADVDLMDPLVQENWFEAYDVLRREAPVYLMPQLGMYVLTRYADIEYVLRRPALFTTGSDVQGAEPLVKHQEARDLYDQTGWPRYTPLGENLPKHAHYRALVDPALSASALRPREDFIRSTVNELIDAWIDDGEVEFIKGFAEPLPMIVIAELLGFPRMDLPQLKEWSYAWVLPFSRGLSLEQEKWAVSKHVELQHYIFETVKEKRRKPQDDIISRLTRIEVEDVELGRKRPLTDVEIIGITDHLLIGGNETTMFALSNGLWLLFRNPDVYRRIEAEPARIRGFVEEVLRIESPTQGLFRYVKEDAEIGGVRIPKGSMLAIRYGAGNRDPERYPDPERPDIERKNAGRHLAFGLGEHVCPGATLSRIEQNIAWEILLRRLRNLRPAPGRNDYRHVPGIWLRALKSIHLQFDKA